MVVVATVQHERPMSMARPTSCCKRAHGRRFQSGSGDARPALPERGQAIPSRCTLAGSQLGAGEDPMVVHRAAMLAVTAMVVVASDVERAPVAMAEIQARLGVTRHYATTIMGKLKRGGLIKSATGRGYVLSRAGEGISIGDIVVALNGIGRTSTRSKGRAADPLMQIAVDELWAALDERLITFLDSVSLESLVRPH